jgi:1-deoxy-D-xylulose-5-phosphate reductoisomerase
MNHKVAILGSTGTIGQNTLSILEREKNLFSLEAISANTNTNGLLSQIKKYQPKMACINTPGSELLNFKDHYQECIDRSDIIVMAISGFAALEPTLYAIKKNKKVALANKESIIAGGSLLQNAIKASKAVVIPVDSEHSALFQLLEKQEKTEVDELILTASGGPFYFQKNIDFKTVKPEVAVQHPQWKMGAKISIDSATLMNKGLEVVEAYYLFGFSLEQIQVWVHPQSILHGAIKLKDNSFLGQFSIPDMKSAIGYAMSYPKRLENIIENLSFEKLSKLEFFKPDTQRFPAVELPRLALKESESHLIALNAVNEECVLAYLNHQITFEQITTLSQKFVSQFKKQNVTELEDIYSIDKEARFKIKELF